MALAALLAAFALPATAQAESAFTQKNRERSTYVDRYGDVPLDAVIRTDERYNHGLFSGPRGWDYWNYLPSPAPYQNPNLWPDKRPTYFFGQFVMPSGAQLTIKGRFPQARYFKFTVYKFEHNTFVAVPGASLPAAEIEPDPGSGNPYVIGGDRTVADRDFTIHVLAEDPPPEGTALPPNTVYVGTDQGKKLLAGFRIYVSDEGYDGAGWGPADRPSEEGPGVTYEAKLADGTMLSAAEVDKQWGQTLGLAPPPYDVEQWYAMVDAKDNDPCMTPATAPACKDSQFEIFYGLDYNVAGAFMTPEKRAEIKLATEVEAGADPTTDYMLNYISRAFGPVYVLRAKLPTFPDTFAGAKTMPDGEVQFWSVATVAAAPSGDLWDGVFDMMVPLDEQGFYTVVVSRPEDRPKNATGENGIAWIDWGPGEGIGDPRNRTDWGMLLMRFMVPHKDWAFSPAKATKPGMAAEVMGPYYPRGYYTTKEQFEADGPKEWAAINAP